MTTRHGDYFIYKFYNKETNDCVTEFFLPDTDVKRIAYRLVSIASMKEKGYKVFGVLRVDKEAYLNARLTKTVEDFLYQDKAERELRHKYKLGEVNADVYMSTMQCIQDCKWTCYKTIAMQIRRMIREDFSVENEVALQLYDDYLKVVF